MDGKQVSNQALAQQLAQALMLEQVKFTKQQLLNSNNNTYLQQFIHRVYQNADKILLKDVIKRQQLHAVVSKYAFELNLGAELLEFIGSVAQKIHHFILNTRMTFHDLLSDESFEIWLDKILELEQVRLLAQTYLAQNSQIQQISLQLANQILESHTPWLNSLRKLKLHEKSLSSKLLSLVQEQQHQIELKLEQQLAQAIVKQIGFVITLPNEELAEIALQIWSDLKARPIRESFAQLSAIDVEEFFILVYEFWKELRQTPQIQAIILHVVDAFYESFAEYDLKSLLNAVGLEEKDLHEEAQRFAPYFLNGLNQSDVLDTLIEALIQPFYQSDSTQKLIQRFLQQ